MNARIEFPAGFAIIPKPTREQLNDSALAWLTLAMRQAVALEIHIDDDEPLLVLRELQRKLGFVRDALTEAT